MTTTGARPGRWAGTRLSAEWVRLPPRDLRLARGGSPNSGDELAVGGSQGHEVSAADVRAQAVYRFLSEELALGEGRAAKVIKQFPRVLGFFVETLRLKVGYLVQDMGLRRAAAVKVITGCPQVLGYSMENNIEPTLQYLEDGMGLGRDGAVKVIAKFPSVLSFSVENNLKPTVRYLAGDVGLGKEGAAKVITGFPSVLGMGVENNIAPKVRYLAEEVGLGRDGAVKVITGLPSVLGLSVDDNLAPKVRFLAEEAGAGREGAANIILQYPKLLSYSIELNLRPKLHFLWEKFPGSTGVQAMRLAAHSLAGKLMPRVRLLERHGMAGRFAASTTAKCTTATFCEKVGLAIEEYDGEVEVCKREHNEMYPSPEWPAAAGEAGDLAARVKDDAIASNKAGRAKRPRKHAPS